MKRKLKEKKGGEYTKDRGERKKGRIRVPILAFGDIVLAIAVPIKVREERGSAYRLLNGSELTPSAPELEVGGRKQEISRNEERSRGERTKNYQSLHQFLCLESEEGGRLEEKRTSCDSHPGVCRYDKYYCLHAVNRREVGGAKACSQ